MTRPAVAHPRSGPPAPPVAPPSMSKQTYSGVVGGAEVALAGRSSKTTRRATMPASAQTDRNHFIHPMMGSPAYLCQADVRPAPTR